eukprot:TRINITY_DN21243_c0_g1_i1.p1 TRINITY_DN21243_c0_g1~~TRINITY_DN21243_c0_g1_i1.p1  ORF type:complete len:631 (+),score=134.84 TRINITY_DN21243_c0_g1_i1:98-1990(+)
MIRRPPRSTLSSSSAASDVYKRQEKLFFPILLFKFSAEELAKKENAIQIKVYDYDPDGTSDVLGFAEFGIHEISMQKESEIDGTFARFLEKTITLERCRSKSASITLKAWFEPHPLEDDDDEEIFLLPPQEKNKKNIDEIFVTRSTEWRDGIRQCAPRAHRKATALCGFPFSAFDEKSCERFLPCYLMPLAGPLDLQNPKEVFRMVSCVVYESDKDVLDDDGDSWASPKFFLDIKKGDEEDHAILVCNLFLGLSIDAYMCLGHGRVKAEDEFSDEVTIRPTEQMHVWVMTRSQDGSVTFWESMLSKEYHLLKRWKGADCDDEESEESEDENEAASEDQDDDDKMFTAFYEDEEMMNTQHIHSQDIFLQDDELAGMGIGDDGSSDEEEDLFLVKPLVLPPYHSIHCVFNHENVWANLQNLDPVKCLYEIDNAMQWKPFCSFEEGFSPDGDLVEPFYKTPTIPTRLKKDRTAKLKKEILEAVKEGIRDLRDSRMLECKIDEPESKGKGQDKHMQAVLSKGLRLMEDRMLANDERKRDNITARLNSWKGELIKSAPPTNLSFEGIPINFAFSDSKRIKKRICEKYEEWLTDSEQDVQFCLGCYIAPYYCSVNSTWLYVTKMKPLSVDDDSDDD